MSNVAIFFENLGIKAVRRSASSSYGQRRATALGIESVIESFGISRFRSLGSRHNVSPAFATAWVYEIFSCEAGLG